MQQDLRHAGNFSPHILPTEEHHLRPLAEAYLRILLTRQPDRLTLSGHIASLPLEKFFDAFVGTQGKTIPRYTNGKDLAVSLRDLMLTILNE